MPPDRPIQFYLSSSKVVVIKKIKKPKPNGLKVNMTSPKSVKLPGESHRRDIVAATAKLENINGSSGHQKFTGYFRYQATAAAQSGKASLTDQAEFELTLTNTPADDPTHPELDALSFNDAPTDGQGDPGDGPIDLLP